ncbi:hypothetical protein GOBAR_AA26357 [Gossypium barbadense]|uniref:Uncharacterized protein n=1 Tax=Gossypium barbadense TaxID=3634 RepID=A0A2P5WT99_GOSBA|nr:hypothetical protein GOBAR_AA26357 [Gossypium barbadense]
MLLMELGQESCIRHKLLATSYHTLYQWYRSVESEHFPDSSGLRARMEQWTFGLYLACIKYLMSAFDVLEFDEAFSSLRITSYKSFTRLHINHDGYLEVFTLAVDKVPRE